MKGEPLISVIIIFYNAQKYLEEAIESVFAQTYENWELLLCDDGSLDGSTEIARIYANRFPERVHYLEHSGHQNRGMSATRNLGLSHAKGELISWLDADDVWLPHKLQRQLQILMEHPEAAMVYGPFKFWYSWTGNSEDYSRDFTADIGVPPDTLLTPPQLTIHILKKGDYVPGGELVWRKVLEEIGGFEETMSDAHEDDIVYAKMGLKWTVFVSGKSWYLYRQHPDSYNARSRWAVNERSERLKYLHKLENHLRNEGHDEGEVWQVVQDQIHLCQNTILKTALESLQRGAEFAKYGYRKAKRLAIQLSGRFLPQSVRAWLWVMLKGHNSCPPIGWVHFGGLRRMTPLNRSNGRSRGSTCDQYYVDKFLKNHTSDIRGCVLEIGDRGYAIKLGGDRVTHSEVLLDQPANPRSTLLGNLSTGEGIPDNAFDCIIVTQMFPFPSDFKSLIATAVKSLKHGGVMLVTLPGRTLISRGNLNYRYEINHFTSLAAKHMFEEHFAPEHLEIGAYGNVLTAVAILHGLAAEEFNENELDHSDPQYEMVIGVRALKSEVNKHDGTK